MNPFFIPKVPDGAECMDPRLFFKEDVNIEHSVQAVDVLWDESKLQRICNEPLDPLLSEFYEIVDVKESPTDKEILNSNCIFRMEPKLDNTREPFAYFFQHLKDKIDLWKTEPFKNQKLIFYVGNDIWDLLHKEKILANRDVEFVRMQSRSRFSLVGNRWRALAYDRYDYPYVLMDDTDMGDSIDARNDERLYRHIRMLRENDHFFFALQQCIFDEKDFPLVIGTYYPDQFALDRQMALYIQTLKPLGHYFNAWAMELIRAPNQLPFESIVSILSYCPEQRESLRTLYDPGRHVFTFIRETELPTSFFRAEMNWILPLIPHLRAGCGVDFFGSGSHNYKERILEIDETHFFRRLLNDLTTNGDINIPGFL